MSTNEKSGHVKNVANFEEIISVCTAFGPAYNPTKSSITLTAMSNLLADVQNSMQTLQTAKTALDNATNAREIVFAGLKKLSTRIVNALQATDAAAQTIDDVKTINRKIQGQRAGSKKASAAPQSEPGAAPVETNSSSGSITGRSYDKLIESFSMLIQVLSAEPLYNPNENDLKTAQLNTLLAGFRSSNTAVINAHTAYVNAKIIRDKLMYNPTNGLCFLANEVKKYVKSLYGTSSPQYHQLSRLRFVNFG